MTLLQTLLSGSPLSAAKRAPVGTSARAQTATELQHLTGIDMTGVSAAHGGVDFQ